MCRTAQSANSSADAADTTIDGAWEAPHCQTPLQDGSRHLVDCRAAAMTPLCNNRDRNCGLGAECVPSDGYSSGTSATCDGPTLTFCYVGRLEHIDCTEFGFTGCDIDRKVDHFGCIPGPVIQ